MGAKIANFVGRKLEEKAEDGKTFCALVLFGEPEYTADILLEEKN